MGRSVYLPPLTTHMKDLGIFIMNAITEALREGKDYTDYINAKIDPRAVDNFNNLGEHKIEYKPGTTSEFRVRIAKY